MKEHESVLVFGKGKVKYNPIMQQRSKSAQERLKYALTEYKGDKRDVMGGLQDNSTYKHSHLAGEQSITCKDYSSM